MRKKSQDLFFRREAGRLSLSARCFPPGSGWLVILSGGQEHIGAVALGEKGKVCCVERAGHREGDIARDLAARLSAASAHAVAVCAGIHYEAIRKVEIATIIAMCASLGDEIAAAMRQEEKMLTMQELGEFEEYIKSGQLERDFKYSPEDRRVEILELLEKMMDVAELADEAATRLIFRGIPPLGREPGEKTQ